MIRSAHFDKKSSTEGAIKVNMISQVKWGILRASLSFILELENKAYKNSLFLFGLCYFISIYFVLLFIQNGL